MEHGAALRRVAPDAEPAAAVSRRARLALRAGGVAGILALAFHLAHGQLGLGGHALDRFTNEGVYDAIMFGVAASCLARAWLVKGDRLAWMVLGIGLALSGTGDLYYSLAFGDSGTPPVPSPADLFYLLYYPAAYVALMLLVRRRVEGVSASTWLDGAIAATTSAAVIAAVAFKPIMRSATHGGAAAVATNLAYPVGDLILLAIVALVFGLTRWQPGRAWLLLGVGLGLGAIADTAYVYANADGTYVVGGILDSLWLASAIATGFAAWQPAGVVGGVRLEGRRLLVVPGAFALVALAVLMYGGFHDLNTSALVLAGAGIIAVIGRAAWTFHDYVRLLERSRHDAVTDALTGLGNRRLMNADLERALLAGAASPEAIFVMFDLDGFKLYNDAFGHMAGDTLLAHFGRRLLAAVGTAGTAYRLGGDEFCVLLRDGVEHADLRVAAAARALSAEGQGFTVTSSFGRVVIPIEAHAPMHALRIADDRMYAQKGRRRESARQQSHDVLLGLLLERQPDLHDHARKVGRLALRVAETLGIEDAQLDDVRQAAELHDIGKAAIPEAIVEKHGPLSDHEWVFMRRHTIIGERILAAAPALAAVAPLVRSSHERWDGTGYPDGLAGEAIPLAARIVAACDAFDAMMSDRPYAPSMSATDAIAELRRAAGTQFDPRVVEAFVGAWRTGAREAPSPVTDLVTRRAAAQRD
jgi:two-component system, cell cycle response regulator